MPLERNMVRFIDNFSRGQRGANSVEWFLAEGYIVIFLHRVGSLVPFTSGLRKLNSSPAALNLEFLSHLKVEGEG